MYTNTTNTSKKRTFHKERSFKVVGLLIPRYIEEHLDTYR